MKLLDKLESSKRGTTETEIKDNASITDFVKTVHDVLTSEQSESKSLISHTNAYGIIQAMNFNNYLEETLGSEFRLEVLDRLVLDKLRYILSVDGKGTKTILQGISSLQPIIQSAMPPTLIERLAFGDSNKEVKK